MIIVSHGEDCVAQLACVLHSQYVLSCRTTMIGKAAARLPRDLISEAWQAELYSQAHAIMYILG